MNHLWYLEIGLTEARALKYVLGKPEVANICS